MAGDKQELSFWQVVLSVIASFFGVQNTERRERDFTQGKASHFIAVGILLTLTFVLSVFGVVKLVLYFVDFP